MLDKIELKNQHEIGRTLNRESSPLSYINEFDSIRAIAVIAVMFSHFYAQLKISGTLGSCGVTLFFVLSGYLITQILLKEKALFNIDIKNNLKNFGFVLKTFYIRRSLRIFPIYYLTLFFLFLLNFESTRQYLFYHLFYASNFLYSFKAAFDHLSNFWSLAVEEQFYLIWPFLILLMPVRSLNLFFFIFIVITSIVFKFLIALKYSYNSVAIDLLMPSCIESFALGASAVLLQGRKIKPGLLIISLLGSMTLFMIMEFFFLKNESFNFFIFYKLSGRVVFSFFSASLLLCITDKVFPKIIVTFLKNRYLTGIGKISYGVYIYHMFVPTILIYIQHTFHFSLDGTGFYLISGFLLSFLMAYISYKAIELPINNLKRKFAYNRVVQA